MIELQTLENGQRLAAINALAAEVIDSKPAQLVAYG
jgi:hypothetical protein